MGGATHHSAADQQKALGCGGFTFETERIVHSFLQSMNGTETDR